MTALLWGLEIQLVGVQKTRKIEKITGSQDDGFAGVLTKKIRSTLMGLASWAKFSKFSRPCGPGHIP
jgi:hypothetical protein